MKGFHTLVKLVFVLFVGMIMLSNPVKSQVIPSDEWINFYSRNTLFQGAPVPIGSVIDAYDPDSVHCGTFTVNTNGEYGFLIVYRDDALTPDVDEGAVPGDTIIFRINGVPVKALGPDSSIWSEKGDILEVNLADNLSPTIADSIEDVFMREDDPDTVIADLDTIFYDSDNDSLTFSSQSNVPDVQHTIDEEHRVTISLAPNWSGEAVVVITAQDVWFTVNDTILIHVMEVNDPPVITDLPDTSFSSDTTLTLNLNEYVEDVDNPKSSLSWIAEVQPPNNELLIVEINDTTKLATFSANVIFTGYVEVVFTVTDKSSASDQDTMSVHVIISQVGDNMYLYDPNTYSLSQNYPNPFNSMTIIKYQLPKYSHVILKIYNSLGQEITTLVDKPHNQGYYTTYWDAGRHATGVYFIVIETGDFYQMRKMLFLR